MMGQAASSAPGRQPGAIHKGLRRESSGLTKFGAKRVDVSNEKAAGGTVVGVGPLKPVMPLQVQFHAVACHGGVFRVGGVVLKREGKPEALVEPSRGRYVAAHEDRVNRVEHGRR